MANHELPTGAEQRWCSALDAGLVGLWDLNPGAETVHYTPQWKARLGLPGYAGPDSTSFWRIRVHPDDLGAMLRALRAHLAGTGAGLAPTYEMRFRLRAGDGRYRHVLSRGRVVERDARGEALRMIGTMVELAAPGATPDPVLPVLAPRPSIETGPRWHPLLRQIGDLLDLALGDAARTVAP